MDGGVKSCDQYTKLSVRIKNGLSGNENRNRRLFDVFGKCCFGNERSILKKCLFRVFVGAQKS